MKRGVGGDEAEGGLGGHRPLDVAAREHDAAGGTIAPDDRAQAVAPLHHRVVADRVARPRGPQVGLERGALAGHPPGQQGIERRRPHLLRRVREAGEHRPGGGHHLVVAHALGRGEGQRSPEGGVLVGDGAQQVHQQLVPGGRQGAQGEVEREVVGGGAGVDPSSGHVEELARLEHEGRGRRVVARGWRSLLLHGQREGQVGGPQRPVLGPLELEEERVVEVVVRQEALGPRGREVEVAGEGVLEVRLGIGAEGGDRRVHARQAVHDHRVPGGEGLGHRRGRPPAGLPLTQGEGAELVVLAADGEHSRELVTIGDGAVDGLDLVEGEQVRVAVRGAGPQVRPLFPVLGQEALEAEGGEEPGQVKVRPSRPASRRSWSMAVTRQSCQASTEAKRWTGSRCMPTLTRVCHRGRSTSTSSATRSGGGGRLPLRTDTITAVAA